MKIMDYMDKLKGSLPLFKIIDKSDKNYGIIIEGRQCSGMSAMYDCKIGNIIYTFHVSKLELQ